jgi:hypothetical protein
MKRNGPDLSRLNECADYVLEHEWSDFEEFCTEGNDPFAHIYSVAFIALHGERAFDKQLKDMGVTIHIETEGERKGNEEYKQGDNK